MKIRNILLGKKLRSRISRMHPADDVFFEELLRNQDVCQKALRVILENDDLIVKKVVPEKPFVSPYSIAVPLAVSCVLGNKKPMNVEIICTDDMFLYRTVCSETMQLVLMSAIKPVKETVPDITIFISESDMLQTGESITQVASRVRGKKSALDNWGQILINTSVKDHSTVSELLECFLQEQKNNSKFLELYKATSDHKQKQKS